MKLYFVSATEIGDDGYERGVEFLTEAKTQASANKKAFRILKNEWDDPEAELVEHWVHGKSLEFSNGCVIPLKTIRVEETTAEEFVKKHIRTA